MVPTILSAAGRLFHRTQPERICRLYGIGTPKSGTHSIAEMFTSEIRAGHEPGSRRLIPKILAVSSGKLSRKEFAQWIARRDSRLALDVDSSSLNLFILDELLDQFSDARFVLTIRDCYSWLNSIANHRLRYRHQRKHWLQFRALRFRPDLYTHAPEERVLEENGVETVDGLLGYWARHNREVIDKVPPERLLIVRTREISKKAREIAAFAGLDPRYLAADQTHRFQNRDKQGIITRINRDFLEDKVTKHCRPLMQRFFPDITSLERAAL